MEPISPPEHREKKNEQCHKNMEQKKYRSKTLPIDLYPWYFRTVVEGRKRMKEKEIKQKRKGLEESEIKGKPLKTEEERFSDFIQKG